MSEILSCNTNRDFHDESFNGINPSIILKDMKEQW